jgi:hypothetical protein
MNKSQVITQETIDTFSKAFKKRLINEDSLVTITYLQHGDTQAIVNVDNIRVGRIITFFANMTFADDMYLYFFPDYSFFDYCKMDSITQFLDYSSQLLKNTLVTLNVLKDTDKTPQKGLLDFRFDLQHEDKQFYGTLCSETICFNETGNLIYRMIKEGDEFKIVDDFKYSIHNHTLNIFDMKRFSNLLSVIIIKDDECYCIRDNSTTTIIYSIEFSADESLPDIKQFADIVFYYSIMLETEMERPLFEDYLSNLYEYKKIVEMSVI